MSDEDKTPTAPSTITVELTRQEAQTLESVMGRVVSIAQEGFFASVEGYWLVAPEGAPMPISALDDEVVDPLERQDYHAIEAKVRRALENGP